MNEFTVPFAKQELLHHLLQTGGPGICPLSNAAKQQVHAVFDIEHAGAFCHVRVRLDEHTGEIKLQRSDRAAHLRLRDFLEDMANGHPESGRLRTPPIQPVQKMHLSKDDRLQLAAVIFSGGVRRLSTGHSVMVHRHWPRCTGIVALGNRTHLVSGSANDITSSLTELIEQTLVA